MIVKSDWELLGIEPTTEIRQIKKAYARELKLCSPEDNPVQFQTLRQVYERVLKYAEQAKSDSLAVETFNFENTVYIDDVIVDPSDKESIIAEKRYLNKQFADNKFSEPIDEPIAADSAHEKFIHQIYDLYEDFDTRIDPKKWDEVIKDEVLWDVETFRIIKTWFLDFLYDGHFVPREVLQTYHRYFLWDFNSDEYHQRYDEVYLTYLKEQINGIITPGYEYLTERDSEDISKYIRYREYGFACYLSGDLNNTYENVIKALDIIPDDPYLLCIFGAYIDAKDTINGRKYIKLGAKLSDDPWRMFFFGGQLLHRLGKLKKALRYYRRIPNNSYYFIATQSAIIDCLCRLEKYNKCGFMLRRKLKKNREDTELRDVLLQYYKIILDLKRSTPNRLIFWYEARMTYPHVRKEGEKNPHKYTANYIFPSFVLIAQIILILIALILVIITRGIILLPVVAVYSITRVSQELRERE